MQPRRRNFQLPSDCKVGRRFAAALLSSAGVVMGRSNVISDSRWPERLLQVANAARHREPLTIVKDDDVFALGHWLKFLDALDVYDG
jgi:hypothetical protein